MAAFVFDVIFMHMILTSLRSFIRHVLLEGNDLDEGGNVSVGGRDADKIEVALVIRDRFVQDMRMFFRNIDQRYLDQTGQHLYDPSAIESLLAGSGFGGSTAVFFDLAKHDELFKSVKKKLGDIDVYIPRETYVNLFNLLRSLEGQKIIDLPEGRSIEYVGQIDENAVGNQINSLFVYNFTSTDGDPAEINMQIDFVKARFTEEGVPHSSIIHSHGSSAMDMMEGIKGFAKNYLIASLTTKLTKVKGKLATPKSTPEKITISKSFDSDELSLFTFSTDYGFRQAREKLGEKDGYDVFINIAYADEKVLTTKEGFEKLFKVEPTDEELELFHSYIGTLQLMRKYLMDEPYGESTMYDSVLSSLLYKCFFVDVKGEDPNDIKITLSQSTERENFALDCEVKSAMINAYYDVFPETLVRKEEIDQMMDRYYQYLPLWSEGYGKRKDAKKQR